MDNVKVMVTLEQARNTHWEVEIYLYSFFNLDTKMGW